MIFMCLQRIALGCVTMDRSLNPVSLSMTRKTYQRFCKYEHLLLVSTKRAYLVAQMVKNLPVILEIWVWSPDQEDLLEKGMATHSSILAWEIPWRNLAGYSPWGRKELDMTEWLTLSLSSMKNFFILKKKHFKCIYYLGKKHDKTFI